MKTPENTQSIKFKDRHELMLLIGVPPEGSHDDEWLPRAATWHQERANMLAEVAKLRTEAIVNKELRCALTRFVTNSTAQINSPIECEYAESILSNVKNNRARKTLQTKYRHQ